MLHKNVKMLRNNMFYVSPVIFFPNPLPFLMLFINRALLSLQILCICALDIISVPPRFTEAAQIFVHICSCWYFLTLGQHFPFVTFY